MALATVADYEALTGTTVAAGAETTRIETLLEWASDAFVAGAEGQAVESATYTDVDLYPIGGIAYFPQRPVTAVSAVKTVDAAGTVTTLSSDEYRWTAGGNRRPAKLIRVRYGRDDWWGATSAQTGFTGHVGEETKLRVTYTAGWSTIPGPIVATVCSMVRAAVANAGGATPTQEAVGPFSASYAVGDLQSPTFDLTPSARAVIAAFCQVDGPTTVPVEIGAP